MSMVITILLILLSVIMLSNIDKCDATSRLVTNQLEMFKVEFEKLKASGPDGNTYKLHEDKALKIMTKLFNMKSEIEGWDQCSEELKAKKLMMEICMLEKEDLVRYDKSRLYIELLDDQVQQKKKLNESLEICHADLYSCKNKLLISRPKKDHKLLRHGHR